MKNKSHSFRIFCNGILSSVLSLFGFTGCFGVKYGSPVAEYGCPSAEYDVSGVVVDESNNPIVGIEVSLRDNRNTEYPLASSITDTNGTYQLNANTFPVDSITVIAKDIDGENNGSFQDQSKKVEVHFSNEEAKWNKGTATVKLDFQLKNKTAEGEQ